MPAYPELFDKNEKLADQITLLFGKVKQRLEIAKELLDQITKAKGPDRNLNNAYNSVSVMFSQTLNTFSKSQSKIKQGMREMLINNSEVAVARHLEPEERDQLVDNPQFLKNIYVAKIEGVHDEVKNAYRDLEERHKEIVKIEDKIQRVHVMMQELAALILQQGVTIDNIAYNVREAKKNVLQAEQELVQAQENIKSSRKVTI